MHETLLLILSLVFLIGTSCISSIRSSIQSMNTTNAKEEFQHYPYFYFFFIWIQKKFHTEKWTGFFNYLSITSQITRLCYSCFAILYAYYHFFIPHNQIKASPSLFFLLIGVIVGIFILSLLTDFLCKILSHKLPYFTLKLFSPLVTLFLACFSWISYVLITIEKNIFKRSKKDHLLPTSRKIKHKLQEFLQEPDLKQLLTTSDRKLLLSISSFKERITKEIMVPRIDIFALSADVTIRDCLTEFIEEGYSRVLIYKDNIDNIVGVVLYKNLLKYFFDHENDKERKFLDTKLEKLITPALFAPESKKISQLLQDFKTHQSHLAIIVDEYGGTEGIVTIEDILEELVGEIADEYDFDEKALYVTLPEGGWIVDAKMSIIDIEKELLLSIPEAPEYETIGGYIFHKAGSIPSKGWSLHHERFDLEVISSSERAIDKIKITPVLSNLTKESESSSDIS